MFKVNSGVFIVNFEYISQFVLVFLFLMPTGFFATDYDKFCDLSQQPEFLSNMAQHTMY